MLMALGSYFFSCATASYENKDMSVAYRWEEQNTIGKAPLYHYMGPGEQTLQLEGAVYDSFGGGIGQIEALKSTAEQGEPLMLVDGLGNVMGQWVVLNFQEKQSYFWTNGKPRKITFSLNLKKYDDRAHDILWGWL